MYVMGRDFADFDYLGDENSWLYKILVAEPFHAQNDQLNIRALLTLGLVYCQMEQNCIIFACYLYEIVSPHFDAKVELD